MDHFLYLLSKLISKWKEIFFEEPLPPGDNLAFITTSLTDSNSLPTFNGLHLLK